MENQAGLNIARKIQELIQQVKKEEKDFQIMMPVFLQKKKKLTSKLKIIILKAIILLQEILAAEKMLFSIRFCD